MNQKTEFDKECIIESFEECQSQNTKRLYCKINVIDQDGKRKQFSFFDYCPERDLKFLREASKNVFRIEGELNIDGFNIARSIVMSSDSKVDFDNILNSFFNKKEELGMFVSFIKKNIVKKKYKKLLFEVLSDKTFVKSLLSSPLSSVISYRGSVLKHLNYSLNIIKSNVEILERDFILNTDVIYCAFIMYYVAHVRHIQILNNEVIYSREALLQGKKVFYIGELGYIQKDFPFVYSVIQQLLTDVFSSTIEGRLFKKMFWLVNQMFAFKYSIDNCEKIDDTIGVCLGNRHFDMIYPSSVWLIDNK